MTIRRPAQYPDLTFYPEDTSKTWTVSLQRNGIEWDVSASTLTAYVLDDEKPIGTLNIDASEATGGVLTLSIDDTTLNLLGRYSTWRLAESPVCNTVLVQGRIVRQR